MSDSLPSPANDHWFVQLPTIFADLQQQIFAQLNLSLKRRIGSNFYWVQCGDPQLFSESPATMFLSWRMPLMHSWPCNPSKINNFEPKALVGLSQKFADLTYSQVQVSVTEPHAQKGFFSALAKSIQDALQENLDRQDLVVSPNTLFCLVGKEGIFASCCPPTLSNGPLFIRQNSPIAYQELISRAGGKLIESLQHLSHFTELPVQGSRWLELGASPGGMTQVLLQQGYRVTAIDRAPLDPRLIGVKGLNIQRVAVEEFQPAHQYRYAALLCDMNGNPIEAFEQVLRLANYLDSKGLIIYTLKLTSDKLFESLLDQFETVKALAIDHQLELISARHLTSNRQELTLFFRTDW